MAREVSHYDFGLPTYEPHQAQMVAHVAAAIREAVENEKNRCIAVIRRASEQTNEPVEVARILGIALDIHEGKS